MENPQEIFNIKEFLKGEMLKTQQVYESALKTATSDKLEDIYHRESENEFNFLENNIKELK